MKTPTSSRRISKNSVGIFADGGGAFCFPEEDSHSQLQDLLPLDSATDPQTPQRRASRPVASFVFRVAGFFGLRKL